MRCPVDQEELTAMPRVKGLAKSCEACGGLWLSPESLRALGAWSPGTAGVKKPRDVRTCSRCDAGMGRIRLSQVEIDVCGSCRGVWLDAGELAVLEEMHAQRGRPTYEPAPAAQESGSSSTLEDAADTVGLVVDVLDFAASVLSIFD